MKKRGFLLITILLLAISMVLGACSNKKETAGSDKGDKKEESKDPKFMSIVTGSTQGTYYPLGGSFAQIIKDATGIEVNAEVSGGSADNMAALKDAKAELGFVQTDIASYAKEGKLMFEGKKVENVKAIGALYPETVQIVTTKDSGIKSVKDLKGKKVSVGAPGSGTFANAEQILEAYGLKVDDLKAQRLSFDESSSGIQDGSIDAAFVTAGTPTAAVESLAATKDVVIVPLDEDKMKALIEKYPFYAKEEVPAGTYKLKEAAPTVAVQAMLVVSDNLSDDLVYKITKAIYENTDKISHAKGKLIKAENGLNGVGIDLHPGAKKYFDEKGVK